jgi:Polysaccharide pyruvyl transferase
VHRSPQRRCARSGIGVADRIGEGRRSLVGKWREDAWAGQPGVPSLSATEAWSKPEVLLTNEGSNGDGRQLDLRDWRDGPAAGPPRLGHLDRDGLGPGRCLRLGAGRIADWTRRWNVVLPCAKPGRASHFDERLRRAPAVSTGRTGSADTRTNEEGRTPRRPNSTLACSHPEPGTVYDRGALRQAGSATRLRALVRVAYRTLEADARIAAICRPSGLAQDGARWAAVGRSDATGEQISAWSLITSVRPRPRSTTIDCRPRWACMLGIAWSQPELVLKVLFVNESTTNSNWGDRAAAFSLKAMVAQAGATISGTITEDDLARTQFGERPKDQEVSVHGRRAILRSMIPPAILVARRRVFEGMDLTADNRVIPKQWEGFGRAADLVVATTQGPWPWLCSAIREADLVVIHGDGAMVGEGIIPRTDLFLAYLAHERLDTPVVLVNHSADFDRPELRRMAEHVYPLFADVVFRDPVSVTRWGHLGGGRFAADSAFMFAPAGRDAWVPLAGRPTYFDVWPDTAQFDPAAPYLCLGGSSLHSTAWRPLELARSYAVLVARLRAVYGGQILLTVSGLQELEAFRPLARELGLPLVSPTIPVQQAVDILGNADAYVGGRWHSAIFALRGGAPVVPLSAKQGKMGSLMQAADLPADEFDAFAVGREGEAIAQALRSLLDAGDALRGRLRSWADGMAENCWENVAHVRRMAAADVPQRAVAPREVQHASS